VCFSIGLVLAIAHAEAAQVNFTPSISATEVYTDNVFLDPDNEEDDWITSVSLGLNLDILGRTSGLQLAYTPSYAWYNDFSELDGWRHNADALAYVDVSRSTRLTARNSYLRTDDPVEDSEILRSEDPFERPAIEADTNRQGRNTYYTNVSKFDATHRFGSDDLVRAGYTYSIRREKDTEPGEDGNEYDIWSPDIGLVYWFGPRWGVELDGRYSNGDYKDDDDREQYDGRFRLNNRFTRHLTGFVQYEHTYLDYDEETDDEDYSVYLPTVGASYQFDKDTRLTAGAGYYIQDRDSEDDDEGMILNIEAFKNWPFRRGNISITAVSGYDIDSQGEEDLGLRIYYEALLRARYEITRRLSGDTFAGYDWSKYPDEDDRTDKSIRAGLGLSFQALQWMTMRLQYDFRDLSSDDENDEYTENRGMFTVTLAPQQPFRLLR
jgi:opacity protein-like surface antigen